MSTRRLSIPIPLPSLPKPPTGLLDLGSTLWRTTTAVPVAAYQAFQSLPALADILRGLTDPEGPLRQLDDAIVAIAGLKNIADALNRISDMTNALDRLAELQDELEALGQMQQSLEIIASLHGPVTSLAKTTESLPQLATAAESLPRLVDQVHSVREVVTHIGLRIDEVAPALEQIAELSVGLESEIDGLGAALAPIASIAGKLPGGRKAAKAAAREQAAARDSGAPSSSSNGTSAGVKELPAAKD